MDSRLCVPKMVFDHLRIFPMALTLCAWPVMVEAQFVRGIVKNTTGQPLSGVEVVLGERKATTHSDGRFRIDSLKPGHYPITVRLVGYYPVRSRVAVLAAEPTELEYLLEQAPVLLPPLVSETRRVGIFGAVGDSSFLAVRGARVQLNGANGGEVLTDSLGRFSFPSVSGGQYLIRVTFPGYTERRILIELKRDEGRELGILLAPDPRAMTALADEIAVAELGKRLSLGLKNERLTAGQLSRWSSMPLCDVPKIQAELGRSRRISILFSLNGTSADTAADIGRLCAWRSDEVELVEFGQDICRDVTSSIAALAGIWCSGRTRNVPRSLLGTGERVLTQPGGIRYVIVWEKR